MRITSFFLSSCIVLCGCATSVVSDRYVSDIDPKYSGAYLCSSEYNASALCYFNKSKSWSNTTRSNEGEQVENLGVKIQNAYCSDGSPRRSFDRKITLVLPQPPAGLPINRANEMIETIKQAARLKIKMLFMDRPPEFEEALLGRQNVKRPPFVVSIPMKQEPVKSFFKRQRLNAKADLNAQGIIAIRDGSEITMGWAPLSLTTLDSNFMGDSFRMPGKIAGSDHAHKQGQYVSLPKNPRLPLNTWLPHSYEVLALFETAMWDSENQILIYTSWTDLEVMRREFVLDVPENEQGSVFKVWPRGYDSRSYNRNVFGGNVEQSVMLKDQDQIWEHYLHEFTQVTEEATADPRTINFKVSLDLGWYCKYGRSVQSLKSE